MSFTPFQNMIAKAAARHGIIGEFKAIQACQAFNGIIPELFPKQTAAKDQIRAKFYKQGVLTIGVPSSAWANEVMIRKHQILKDANARLPDTKGTPKIKDLKTQVISQRGQSFPEDSEY
jgi:hypothetical protein